MVVLLQKLRNMRAALSDSLSNVVGQNASDPSLFDSLFTGAPNLSANTQSLSKPAFPPVFVFCHIVWPDAILVAGEQGCLYICNKQLNRVYREIGRFIEDALTTAQLYE